LQMDDLDTERNGLHLDASWTKNRKSGFQPLPAQLVKRMKAFRDARTAAALYRKFHRGHKPKAEVPSDPLLYVPRHTARTLYKDLAAAGIPRLAPGGKIDFHACRVVYINSVLHAGAGLKEAQTLARHATPDLTLNVYGRAREDQLLQVVEAVGREILSPESTKKAQSAELRKAAGTESSCFPIAYGSDCLVGVRGFEPPTS